MMTKTQVLAMLKEHQNERGIEHWNRRGAARGGLKSYGIGLTRLRQLARQTGRDDRLARQLWKSDIYDARVFSLLIDDPKKMSRDQAEQQVEELNPGQLSHVFSSCDAVLAKTPFAFELACDWMENGDAIRRRCGYGLLYEFSKKKIKVMDDAWLLDRIDHIQKTIHGEEMWVREAMNGALMGIGKRNRVLNAAAIQAARAIGPVDVDYGDDNACEPLDVLRHLTSETLQKRLKRQ